MGERYLDVVLQKSDVDLFKELFRLYPLAEVEDYYKGGQWQRELLKLDIQAIFAHREEAGAPEAPPLDEATLPPLPGLGRGASFAFGGFQTSVGVVVPGQTSVGVVVPGVVRPPLAVGKVANGDSAKEAAEKAPAVVNGTVIPPKPKAMPSALAVQVPKQPTAVVPPAATPAGVTPAATPAGVTPAVTPAVIPPVRPTVIPAVVPPVTPAATPAAALAATPAAVAPRAALHPRPAIELNAAKRPRLEGPVTVPPLLGVRPRPNTVPGLPGLVIPSPAVRAPIMPGPVMGSVAPRPRVPATIPVRPK